MNINQNNNYPFSDDQLGNSYPQSNPKPASQYTNGNYAAQTSTKGNKIYIGNLNYELDTPDLKEAFSTFGEIIDAVVIKDKESGCSRGFGFVTFAASNSAREALTMHGQELDGRRMRVKPAEAKPQQRQSPFIFTGDEEVY